MAVCLLGMVATLPTHAADLYWNGSGSGAGTGGTGTWNTSSAFWKTTAGGTSYQAWPTTNPSTSVARFATASALTIANGTTIYANGLNFGADTSLTSGNASSKLVINGTSPTITLATASAYLNTTIELTGSTGFTSSTAAGQTLRIGSATSTSAATGSLTASSGTITLFSSGNRGSLGVGQMVGTTTLGNSTGTVDFAGAQVIANLSSLRVGQMFLNGAPGHSTVTTTGTFDFGTNAASTSNIEANLPVGVGVGGGLTGGLTHAGTTTGTMYTRAGTHTFNALLANGPVVKIGEMTSDGTTNGSNISTVTGTWNISGGTTTLTPLTGFVPSTQVSILIANRTATLGVNTTVAGTLNLTGGTLNVNGGHIAEANNTAGATSTVTLDGGTLNLNGGSIGLSTGLIDNLNFRSGTLSNVGQINNGAVLNKTTSGTLRLNGTNSYTGGTTLTLGTLQAGSDTAFGSGALTLTAGKLSSDSVTARAISNAVTFGGDVTLGDAANTGVLTFNGAGTLTGNRILTTESNVTYAAAIGGVGFGLTKSGTGMLTLGGANTYTGGTIVNVGTLALGASDRLANTGALTVSGGTFDLGGFSDTVAAVTLNSGTIANGTLTGASYSATNSGSVSAVLAGSGVAFTKSGAGSVTFSAANTYTGNTIVSGGTLILSGSGSIANSAVVDVQAGAILSTSGVTFGATQTVKGNGTIIGNTTIQGTLAAGNSPGILTFDDNLTLTSSANSIFEIENTGMVRGTDYDGVNVVGSVLTYDGNLTLSLTALVGDGTYNLFDFGSIAGNFDTVAFSGGIYTGTFSYSAGFWTATDVGSGQTFSFELATGDLTVIPEPSTTLLLTGALTALVIFRRRTRG